MEELALGREVVPVVEHLGVVEGDELVTEGADLTVHDETLKVNVRGAEHGETGGLVAATGLETDETVLDDVDTADTVATSDRVGGQENVLSVGGGLVLADELDRQTLLEDEGEVLRRVRGLQWVDGELPHVLRGRGVGVLEDTSFVTAVGKVLVHAPWLGLGAADGNTGLGGVVEEVVTASETLVEFGQTPWGDNLDLGLEGQVSKLETDLVVTLSSATVGDSGAALLLCDLDLGTGDNGTGKGCSLGAISMELRSGAQ